MKETTSTNLKTGYFCAFLCAFFSALMIVLIKYVEAELPTLSILFLSQCVAGLVLTVLVFAGRRHRTLPKVKPRGWVWLVGISLLTFFSYWIWFIAIDLLDPTVASFLGRTETLVTILFGMVVLGERFSRNEVIGGALVLAGVVSIRYTGGMEISKGFLFCVGGALLWGITEGLAKVAVAYVQPLIFTWGRCLILIPIFFAASSLSHEGLTLPSSAYLWSGLVGLAVSGPVIGRFLYMKSLSLMPVSKTALVLQFQPIWVAVIAGVLIDTFPSPKEWFGGALIIAGCILLVRRVSGSRHAESPVSPTAPETDPENPPD